MNAPERVVIGNAELWWGDCREVLPTLPNESADVVWTDPPYGHANHDGDWNARLNAHRGLEDQPIANDAPETMREVVDFALHEASRILCSDCCCCCCCCGGGGPRPTFAWIANRMDADGLQFFHSVIWDKVNPGLGWRYRREHEMVMVAHRKGGKLAWSGEVKAIPNVLKVAKPRDGAHPNIKPVELVEVFIRAHAARSQTVLDPFMGSGTTGVACMNLGRKFIGIELERKYFDIACERIENAQRQGRLTA
jgi:site-specific DNA-methyltransferase (adenine-specific)